MDPPNVREALREIELDIAEGRRHRHGQAGAGLPRHHPPGPRRFDVPDRRLQRQRRIRHGQGGRANGWIDGDRATMEILASIKRAGADIIITYHAKEAARALGR